MAYKIVNNFVPASLRQYKCPYTMKPTTVTIHNTGNTANARNEVAYMNSNYNYTSYHVAIDDKEAVQAIPFNRNAFASGDGTGPNSGNRTSIHIEICYSLDNGYSGAMSKRYRDAEENAALYTAHVLVQYGWGTDRLRQHWHWSRKDCPHKMRAHGRWGAFVKRVQQHMNAIRKNVPVPKAESEAATTPKVSTKYYTVRAGDSLWSIAKANNTSVANLKKWNKLKSNIIYKGQKLQVNASNSSSTAAVKKPSPKVNRARDGWKWAGTFTANSTIVVRWNAPGLKSLQVDKNSFIQKGQWVNFDNIYYRDGYWWIRFKYPRGANNQYFFMPVGVRNKDTIKIKEANKNNKLWGKITHLNSNEAKAKVINWSKKGAISK